MAHGMNAQGWMQAIRSTCGSNTKPLDIPLPEHKKSEPPIDRLLEYRLLVVAEKKALRPIPVSVLRKKERKMA